MRVCVLFYNLGGYHLARLHAAYVACDMPGTEFHAIEITGSTDEHPWGELERPEYVTTLFAHRNDPTPTVAEPELLRSKLNEIRPEVLAIPGWGFDFSRIAIRWARKNDCRLVLMSESKKDDAPRSFFKEKIKQHLWVNKFDAALVGGQKHADYLVQLGMNRDRIFMGYDVVDNDYFSSQVALCRKRWRTEPRPSGLPANPYFLAANRFIARKNLQRLVSAFALATSNSDDPWDLVLLGGGSDAETASLKMAIERTGLGERIHLPGFVPYDQICDWYAAASVFVHPAISEQWGLVVNEAMASSLPVLLSNACGCHPELVDEGVNGFSFNPQDENELAAKMIEIQKLDLGAMGNASSTLINQRFSAKHFGLGLRAAIENSFSMLKA